MERERRPNGERKSPLAPDYPDVVIADATVDQDCLPTRRGKNHEVGELVVESAA